jgi:hypothetical protein
MAPPGPQRPGPSLDSTRESRPDAANDIWAVGYAGNSTFSAHYDGTSWHLVRTPNVGTGPNFLWGVAALAPTDVWAVGYSTASSKPPPGQFQVPTKTLIEHYDGV